ncbi:MAG: xanthine dehydrogenase family protein molybdopterin-binding subunit [SAR324 cluster bacterium]|nr:xanthine dehydrogenase family protein molybdopterin-binding subunit [SAR324 cluster bacterium]
MRIKKVKMYKYKLKRRSFIKSSTLAATSLIIGFTYDPQKSLAAKTKIKNELGIWIRISSDDTITLIVPSSEMGQGVNTSLPMIIAEELDANWESIRTETAPANSDYKNPEGFGPQITGGSNSVKGFWNLLQETGAAAREMLVKAAAQRWNVPLEECDTKLGNVIHKNTNKKLSYGKLAVAASKIEVPSSPTKKSKEKYSLVGKSIQRIDVPEKVTGAAKFGIDIRLPEMLFATVRQSPIFGGKILSLDEVAAKAISGVKAVVAVPNGIAVVADNTWRAKKGMDALNPQFTGGETTKLSSQNIHNKLITALDEEGKAKIDTEKSLDLEYEVPFLAHSTLEPMNCTASVKGSSCEVWVPTQNQGMSMDVTKEITGLNDEKIKINTTLLGGGFGRRGETDFVTQAVTISKSLSKPVQVTWMREEDMQHDFYRPACISRFQIGLSKEGLPIQWENQLAGPSILKRFVAAMGWFGVDPTSTEGANELPYTIPDFNFDYSLVDTGVPVGFWRSVGSSYNAFFTECAIDEAAILANQDPYEYRLKLLKDQPRYIKVLEKVAKNANWEDPLPKNHGLGLAIHKSFGSIVSTVIEVSSNAPGIIKLQKAWIVIDCGKVVNPDIVMAQMEGGFIFGLSAALGEEITMKDGRVEQSNFHDYSILRLKGSPKISVEIVESGSEIGGVGEPAVPLAAPALINAIFSVSGKRIRSLPLSKHGIVIA